MSTEPKKETPAKERKTKIQTENESLKKENESLKKESAELKEHLDIANQRIALLERSNTELLNHMNLR